MPKIVKELVALEVKRLIKPGWHAVGGVAGLLLQVRPAIHANTTPPRSWVLRILVAGQRQVIGLGSYPTVTLAMAKEAARELSADARNGVNLIGRKRARKSDSIVLASRQKTFQECTAAYLSAHASDYTNEKHRKQWASTLKAYAFPLIGKLIVADVGTRHILDVLMQQTAHRNGSRGNLWHIKTETAKRLLDRMRAVLDYATVNEYRSGTNPATWKGHLDTQLPSPGGLKKVKHQPSVPYSQIGPFIAALRLNDCISARALELLVLTGVRSGSVRFAEWSEIDINNKLWTIPAEHTKTKEEHRVPLQPQAIKLLEQLPRFAGTEIVFSSKRGKALSDMALSQLMRGMRERGELTVEAVPHGFRSTFRDWAAEQTSYPDEIRKAASGHAVGDAVKQAYQRTDLLEKRRCLMNNWADFIG